MSSEKLVLSSRSPSNNVVILTLNRPKAKNALSTPLFEDLNAELDKADKDDSIRAIVITGGEKVFAAGADIKEMKDKTCKSTRRGITDDSRRGIPKQFPRIMG
jgi:enoyl-CoA hydratase